MKGMVERFNDDFIETRRKALDRFLSKISEHPTLSYNQHFKVFLTAEVGVSPSLTHTHTLMRKLAEALACVSAGRSCRLTGNRAQAS